MRCSVKLCVTLSDDTLSFTNRSIVDDLQSWRCPEAAGWHRAVQAVSRKEESYRTSNVTFFAWLSGKSRCGESKPIIRSPLFCQGNQICVRQTQHQRYLPCCTTFYCRLYAVWVARSFPFPRLLPRFPITCLGAHMSATLRLCGRFSCLFLEMAHRPHWFFSIPFTFRGSLRFSSPLRESCLIVTSLACESGLMSGFVVINFLCAVHSPFSPHFSLLRPLKEVSELPDNGTSQFISYTSEHSIPLRSFCVASLQSKNVSTHPTSADFSTHGNR